MEEEEQFAKPEYIFFLLKTIILVRQIKSTLTVGGLTYVERKYISISLLLIL